ncbi:MAG: hypothetical protein GSR80_001396 [Desulfurococcales archaeon]|nr:hypothetical protein [Desulfurococcales archaeon]
MRVYLLAEWVERAEFSRRLLGSSRKACNGPPAPPSGGPWSFT